MRITWKKAEIGSTFVPTTIATKRLVSTHAIAEYHNESAIAQMSYSLPHSANKGRPGVQSETSKLPGVKQILK